MYHKWVQQIWQSSLLQHLVWQSLHTILMKHPECVPPATTFVESDCNNVIQQVLDIVLTQVCVFVPFTSLDLYYLLYTNPAHVI